MIGEVDMKNTVALVLLISIAACGGGDDSAAPVSEICTETQLYFCPASAFRDPFGIGLTVAWYTGQCTREVYCNENPDKPAVDPANGVIDDAFVASNWTTTSLSDSATNDDFDHATPFILRPRNGVLIEGELTQGEDVADYYAFIMDGEATITIYLCASPSDCLQPWYQGSDMYLTLHDYQQNMIDSTEAPGQFGHAFTGPFLTNGEQYFLVVRISETASGQVSYKLVITD